MARAGLGKGWECLFANDFDHKKCETYRRNWGGDHLKSDDIRNVQSEHLPNQADLVWASFPCQDLSLAGGGAGLKGERSGTFWPFWDIMKGLISENRAPDLVVLENVCGTLSSHDGKDFGAIATSLRKGGYRFGAVVIDAALFVPQSRPRLFIIGFRNDLEVPKELIGSAPSSAWHTRALKTAHSKLAPATAKNWVWWDFPTPPVRKTDFAEYIEDAPDSVSWHTPAETRRLLAMMSDLNLSKVKEAKRKKERVVGTVYKRTRRDAAGRKVQRAEVRFDGVAGCLRTPAGGSSRQLIVVIEGRKVRSRLISSRETARLMGLPDAYKLPANYNEAYHLTGDGIVVPVVRHLAAHLLEPILLKCAEAERDAA